MRGIWRWVSPSTLLLALLVSPMPWVEIHCTRTNPAGETITSVTTVSGLQAALGRATCNGKTEFNPGTGSGWLKGYFVAVVAGVAVGYRLRMGRGRCIGMSVSVVAAILLLASAILFDFGMVEALKTAFQAPPRAAQGRSCLTPWLLLVYSLHLVSLLTVAGDWLWLRRPRAPANLFGVAVSSP